MGRLGIVDYRTYPTNCSIQPTFHSNKIWAAGSLNRELHCSLPLSFPNTFLKILPCRCITSGITKLFICDIWTLPLGEALLFHSVKQKRRRGGVECGDGLPAPRLCESTTVEHLQSVNYTRVIFDDFNHCKFDLQMKLDNNSRSAHN